jgi:hypothetical protein
MAIGVSSLADMHHKLHYSPTHLTRGDYCDLTLAAQYVVRDDLDDCAIMSEMAW